MLTELYGILLFLIHMEEMEAQRDTAASLRSHCQLNRANIVSVSKVHPSSYPITLLSCHFWGLPYAVTELYLLGPESPGPG